MLRGGKRLLAAEKAYPWRHFFCNSTASFSSSSSSSRKSSSLHNYYIRKRRKWPIQPYKSQWLDAFAHKLAKQSFKQSIKTSKIHLLSDLIKAFSAYEIDPIPQSYHLLFKILIQTRPSNCHDQISQVLDHIEKVENFETPECIYVDLIRFYGENHMFNEAVELFLRIPRFRCVPSVDGLNALLLVLCKDEKGLENIPSILIQSQVLSIRIQKSSFEILIRALCKIGRSRNALELLNHMVEEGLDVDQKVCSLVLATMCRQLDCSDSEIMEHLEDLKRLGFEPRKGDFFTVIRFLVKREKSIDALRLLRQMNKNGIKPDIMCYNLVLEALIHERDFSNADKVFDELLVFGLVPDIFTYNMYINGLCMQDKVEDGIELMGSMKELRCLPNSNTFCIILRSLCEAGKLDRAREVVNDMMQKHMQLDPHTYEILLGGSVCNGDANGACILLNETLNGNMVPQASSTFNSVDLVRHQVDERSGSGL